MSGQISLTFREVSELLRNDADAVARSLLPAGKYEMGGREWRCTGSNSPTGSAICVHVGHGSKQGVCGFWNESQEGGDLLDLYQLLHGCGPKEAIDWAKGWLGIEDAPGTRANISSRRRKELADRQRERERVDELDRSRRLETSRQIWKASVALDEPASVYLVKRGIDPSYAGTELRMHRNLRYPTGDVFPAVVGRVCNVHGSGVGIWRIYLKPTGDGKAPVENPKLGLGNVLGGAVRIGGMWTEIGVAEGIETALACRQLIHRTTGSLLPVWSALSSTGIAALRLPPEIRSVRIFADNDAVKVRNGKTKESSGMAAADALAERLRQEGRAVRIEASPVGMDWLDVLNSAQQQKISALMPAA